MDDLVEFLVARVMDDNHAYAYVAGTLGGEALLDSHLPMLDLIEQLAHDYQAMDPSDSRSAGWHTRCESLASHTPSTPPTSRNGAHSRVCCTFR